MLPDVKIGISVICAWDKQFPSVPASSLVLFAFYFYQ